MLQLDAVILRFVLEKKADVTIKEEDRESTPLHDACSRYNKPDGKAVDNIWICLLLSVNMLPMVPLTLYATLCFTIPVQTPLHIHSHPH